MTATWNCYYETETTWGRAAGVRISTKDRKGAHGAYLYRWVSGQGPCGTLYSMEWYKMNHGSGDWYQGASDVRMSEECFNARADLIEECLDRLPGGMTSNEVRDAVSDYIHGDS